ncbi:MAG: fatty acyl-AMP ligase [Candidatus Firestonebacteria bacterium]|nr:fatty acyl-AMP ligase [Candidatus Firestonebacteria bacterium]
MQTILEALESLCIRRGDEVFCDFIKARRTERIRYIQLYRGACRYARLFQGQSLTAGDVVLIILNHTPDMYYAFLGAILSGLLPAFMPALTSKQDPMLYWESHRTLFQHIAAGAVLTTPEQAPRLRQQMPELSMPVITPQDAGRFPTQACFSDVDPDAPAFLQHSSGTTGLKKGVALTHRALWNQVNSYAASLNLSPSDRIVSWLPLYHDMGLIACFLLPLLTGTPLVQLDPFEWVAAPQMLFDAIEQYRATLIWQPNFAFQHLCRTVRRGTVWDLSSLRAWINCSEPCKAETFALFAEQFAALGVSPQKLHVAYAMAETVFAVTQTQLDVPVRHLQVDSEHLQTGQKAEPACAGRASTALLSTGQAIPGMKFQIIDEHGAPVGDRQIGEVAVSGNSLFSGYFKRAEETEKKLRDHWYFTGDLGFSCDQALYITGRKHDLIIVHGKNFYAHELEFTLNQIPGVKPGRAVAAGYFRQEIGSEEVVVLAEAESSYVKSDLLVTEIKQVLLDTGGPLPFDVCIVPPGWLVKTTSGKISRGANLEKYLGSRQVLTA